MIITTPSLSVRITDGQAHNIRRMAAVGEVRVTRAEFKSLSAKGIATMNPGHVSGGMCVAYLTPFGRAVADVLATSPAQRR